MSSSIGCLNKFLITLLTFVITYPYAQGTVTWTFINLGRISMIQPIESCQNSITSSMRIVMLIDWTFLCFALEYEKEKKKNSLIEILPDLQILQDV